VIRLALVLALLAATTAHAQRIYRCVDARGVVSYTEKPSPECKATRIETSPAPTSTPGASANPAAKAPPPLPASATRVVKQSAPTALTAKAHCDGLSREAAILSGEKNSSLSAEAQQQRLAGIRKELQRSCGR
jgi:hypothetical protein